MSSLSRADTQMTASASSMERKVEEVRNPGAKKASYATVRRIELRTSAQVVSAVKKKIEEGMAETKASSDLAHWCFRNFELNVSSPWEEHDEWSAKGTKCTRCGSAKSRVECMFFGHCGLTEEKTGKQTKWQVNEKTKATIIEFDFVHVWVDGSAYAPRTCYREVQSEGLNCPWFGFLTEEPSPSPNPC